jgi:uncharacterized membrane protein YuzA (DUF378 family)
MTLSTIKSGLFTNWHFVRILRLIFGVFAAVQAITYQDGLAGVIGALFLFQAITNTGCSVSGCTVPVRNNKNDPSIETVEYEEVNAPSSKIQ